MSGRKTPAKRRAEKPVDSEIRAAGERINYTPTEPEAPREPSMKLDAQTRDSLSNLLTGGLWTSFEEDDAIDSATGGPHAAMLHLLALQTKILAIAMANRDSDLGAGRDEYDWCADEQDLTDSEIVTTLHALSTFAREGRAMLDTLMAQRAFTPSYARQVNLEAKAAERGES